MTRYSGRRVTGRYDGSVPPGRRNRFWILLRISLPQQPLGLTAVWQLGASMNIALLTAGALTFGGGALLAYLAYRQARRDKQS